MYDENWFVNCAAANFVAWEYASLRSAYAPLSYVLPNKKAAYDAKYSTQLRDGTGYFHQADREDSLIHLLRVNVLKRMESAVSSFALTVQRQLAQRVSGRMVLLDVSATGEENIIEQQSGDQMNDLEYRRVQLLKLQGSVIELEDLSSGVAITDLTLTDFRIDLAEHEKMHPGKLAALPLGACAVLPSLDADISPGVILCLRAEGGAGGKMQGAVEAGYPLAPHYLVHCGDDGAVLLPYTQAKTVLDRLKRLCVGRDLADAGACARFERATRHGEDMRHAQKLLAAAVASIVGKAEERAAASLFELGGTHAAAGEFFGANDFEVLAYLLVLGEHAT